MDITNSTVFIPGATSGIGLGLALRLQQAGSTVIVGGRRTELLETIAREHPGIHTARIDTTDPASIAAAFDDVTTRFPALDTLIAMAGIMQPEDLRDASFLEVAEATVTTNLLGPIRLVAAFEPFLETQPSATIMTVSSGLAFVPLPATPTYSATKAAIHSFSESLRVQLADTAVEVVELVPPAVQTSLMNQDELGMGMPLEEFLDETMELLAAEPSAPEVQVENVKFLRHAVARGTYDETLALLASRTH